MAMDNQQYHFHFFKPSPDVYFRLTWEDLAALLFASLLFVHPLLRGNWDLWGQTPVHLFWAAVLAVLTIQGLVRKNAGKLESLWIVFSETVWPLGLFLASAFLSALLSPYTHSVDRALLNDIAALCFFSLMASVGAPYRAFFLKALLGGAFLSALLSIPFPGMGLPNPNATAALLLIALPPTALTALESPRGPQRIVWGSAAALEIVLLVATRSLWAYLILLGFGVFST